MPAVHSSAAVTNNDPLSSPASAHLPLQRCCEPGVLPPPPCQRVGGAWWSVVVLPAPAVCVPGTASATRLGKCHQQIQANPIGIGTRIRRHLHLEGVGRAGLCGDASGARAQHGAASEQRRKEEGGNLPAATLASKMGASLAIDLDQGRHLFGQPHLPPPAGLLFRRGLRRGAARSPRRRSRSAAGPGMNIAERHNLVDWGVKCTPIATSSDV